MSITSKQTTPAQTAPPPTENTNTKCPWCKDIVPLEEVQKHKDICKNRPRALKDHK